jgi:hypothetical protein
MEQNLTFHPKPEDIRRYCGELVSGRLDKERKFKTIQANIDEFDISLDRVQLMDDIDDNVWFTQPVHAVLQPIEWSMMETLRKVKESKEPLIALAHIKPKNFRRPSSTS